MFRKILTITVVLALIVVFGCQGTAKKAPPSSSSLAAAEPNKTESNVTKENLTRQLDTIEKEIKNDAADTEPNV
jgi:peptidoglycan hydrolase CwlO-like protein